VIFWILLVAKINGIIKAAAYDPKRFENFYGTPLPVKIKNSRKGEPAGVETESAVKKGHD
jgi:hypothetical protein